MKSLLIDFTKLPNFQAEFSEVPILDLNLSISYDAVSIKVYDKRDNFDFDIVNFPFLDVPFSAYLIWCVYTTSVAITRH